MARRRLAHPNTNRSRPQSSDEDLSPIDGALIENGLYHQSAPIDETITHLVSNVQAAQIVYCDPPWAYGNDINRGTSWSASPARHYPLIVDDDMRRFFKEGVRKAMAANSILAIWVPNSQLPLALELIGLAGCRYAAKATWRKRMESGLSAGCVSNGAIRPCSEDLILAHRGSGLRQRPSVQQLDSVFDGVRKGHSAKPTWVRDWLTQAYGPQTRRVELFCRDSGNGWTPWGNQAQDLSKDISQEPAQGEAA
jgi:N6-adenosine-specific RNA methylase IME4